MHTSERQDAGLGAGMLLGVAIGLIIGMLYTPRTGKEMREMIKEKAEVTRQKAGNIMEEARKRAVKIIEGAKGEGEIEAIEEEAAKQ